MPSSLRLPDWAAFDPAETHHPIHPQTVLRLITLANIPPSALTLRDKAKLHHRSHNWLARFRTRDDPSPLTTLTTKEAIALYRVIGPNAVSAVVAADQPLTHHEWGGTAKQYSALIRRAKKGTRLWI